MAAENVKSAVLRAMIEGVLSDIMVKTNAENVVVDNTTLSAKLAEILASLGNKLDSSAVDTKISAAIDALIGGAPETYNTLKEIADYIEQHETAASALSQAIGQKADKETVTAIQETLSKLGSLANKSKVAETDLEDSLKQKINDASAANHSHSNKTTLDKVTEAKLTEWDKKATVYIQSGQPGDLKAGDLWFQITE